MDMFSPGNGPAESVGLVWSTAWSGDGARQFANLLGMQSSCWEETARNRSEGVPSISALAQVRVDGSKVALARGLTQGVLGTVAGSASRFDARVARPAPPLGHPFSNARAGRDHLVVAI